MRNTIPVKAEVDIDDVWSALSYGEQKEFMRYNLDLDVVSDDDLISELESRGYEIKKEE